MDKEDALLALMLSELPQVGPSAAARIVAKSRDRGHGLGAFFRLPAAILRDDFELHDETVDRITATGAAHLQRCQWLQAQLEGAGGWVWGIADAEYPRRLRERVVPPPVVVFACGAAAALDRPTLAVLHSRTLTEHTVQATTAIAQQAAGQGFAVVSGGMKATYRIASVAARAAQATRVIVLDRGLFATLGAQFDRDAFGLVNGNNRLDLEHSLILSPFRLMDHAAAHNGLRRDEVVAGLADVVVAVHARPGGQIERVCLAALDRGQSVLSWYGENAGLVAAGAAAVQDADLRNLARFLPLDARH